MALLPGRRPQERLDIADRVFCINLQPLMALVVDKQSFGEVIAHVGVIKIQKSGLPQAYCIVFLSSKSKLFLL